jgi:hypothetical protein
MVSILQKFDFSYIDGDLFNDRAGILSRRLKGLFPELELKDVTLLQWDYASAVEKIQIFFGISAAQIQLAHGDQDSFSDKAYSLYAELSEAFEISTLKHFSFRHVLGRACNSYDEAQELIWPLVAPEQREKLLTITDSKSISAIQSEFSIGNFAFEGRFAILDLPVEGAESENRPHMTFQLQATGKLPIEVVGFDPKAFIENVKAEHTTAIMNKLAPHL